ncbi:MAG: phosphatidate cytidylyltransferase [Acetobacter sp.]|nr:phosphatidate cytidylyltransferase [Acetobacter sp.]
MSDIIKQSVWGDLRKRLISAFVLGSVAAACIAIGGVFYKALVLVIMGGMAAEAATLFGVSLKSWQGVLYCFWAICAGLSAASGYWAYFPAFCFGAFVFAPALWAIMCLIVAAGTALLWLYLVGVWSVVFVIAVVVASDGTAYAVGRLIGGPKLAPRISPGKTCSGAFGGLVGALLAGLFVAVLSGSGMFVGAVVWAMVLGVVAQLGDLAESAMKRSLGVKDSGKLLPGHGGLLDRFDGLVMVAPVAAFISICAVNGGAFWGVTLSDMASSLVRVLPS